MKMAQKRRALDEAQTLPGTDSTWFAQTSMASLPGATDLGTAMGGLEASLPADLDFGMGSVDDSWMNWQGFMDDMTQNSGMGWTDSVGFPPQWASDGW